MSPSTAELPAWGVMWILGVVIYFAVKAAMVAQQKGWTWRRLVWFLFTTPTLNAAPFIQPPVDTQHKRSDDRAWTGFVGLVAGFSTWALLVPAVRLLSPWAAGLTAAAGGVCMLHFGAFRLLTAFQTRCGFAPEPIMLEPWRSTSLAEFWGRRWNTAFRDAATALIVRPLKRRWPPWALLFAVFAASGVVHDIVISLPVGGYGQPTAYFLLQAVGQLIGKTPLARRVGLNHGWLGTVWTALWLLVPLPLLFHEPFCVGVMLPFYDTVWAGRFLPRVEAATTVVSIGGGLQLSVLIASAATPMLLDWREELGRLSPLMRTMFWVYGGYIVAAIVGLAAASLAWPEQLAGGTSLGIGLCGFSGLFWGGRLAVGVVAFDPSPYLTTALRQTAYAMLTLLFVLLTVGYTSVAIHGLTTAS